MLSLSKYLLSICGLTALIVVPASASVTYNFRQDWGNQFNIHDPMDHVQFSADFDVVLPDYLTDGVTTVNISSNPLGGPYQFCGMGGTSDGSVYGGRCTQVVFDVRDGGSEIGVSLRGCPMGWPTSPIECPTTPSEWTWLYGGAGFSDVVPNQPGFYYDNGDRAGTYGDGVTGETLLTINWDLATIPEPSTFGLAGAALALAGLGYRKHRSTLADTTVSTAMKTQRR